MKTLKEKLSEVITTKPDVLQFAKDRKYEESWIIPLDGMRPTAHEVDAYLKKDSFDLLIAEFIWNSTDDDKRFVLTLFFDDKCYLKSKTEFTDITLDLFYGYKDLGTFLETINQNIIGNDYLLKNPIDSVNMSVFNHWLSVGPVELWKKGDRYDAEGIKNKIAARPEIERTQLNYQGLLFRFNIDGKQDGPVYGIKTPCCNKVGNEWVVDYDKIDYWMRLMLGI